MPTQDTPLKDRKLSAGKHRKAMIQSVCGLNSRFRLCTMEMERKGKSYTIDTVRALHRLYPEHEFYWMIGNDQMEQFDRWKQADVLVALCHVVCVDRDQKLGSTPYDMQRIHMPSIPVSSSEIRVGNKLNYVPVSVLEYIYTHRLYIKDFVRTRVNEHRYFHSISVANLCEEMAVANGLDGHKAYLIGLFHDIAKSMDKEHMEPWMDSICPENKKYPVPVWHGFVGSEVVDRIFYIREPDIKEAIYHHVLGTSTNPYAMVVFCADKTDPLRKYDSEDKINACKKDIARGFQWIKDENKRYLQKGK